MSNEHDTLANKMSRSTDWMMAVWTCTQVSSRTASTIFVLFRSIEEFATMQLGLLNHSEGNSSKEKEDSYTCDGNLWKWPGYDAFISFIFSLFFYILTLQLIHYWNWKWQRISVDNSFKCHQHYHYFLAHCYSCSPIFCSSFSSNFYWVITNKQINISDRH